MAENMKCTFAVVIILVVGAFAQMNPPKPWTPEMCQKEQAPRVSESYVRFCMKASPGKFPACSMDGHDPREGMWAAQAAAYQGKHGAYLEVLDCSWHSGQNPRETTRAKKGK